MSFRLKKFSAILPCPMTLGNAPLFPSSISIDASVGGSHSTSAAASAPVVARCRWLLTSADFINNFLLGFGSAQSASPSIRVMLMLLLVGADAAGVTLLPLSFFW